MVTGIYFLNFFSLVYTAVPAPMFLGPMAAELGGLVLAVGFYVSSKKFDNDYSAW